MWGGGQKKIEKKYRGMAQATVDAASLVTGHAAYRTLACRHKLLPEKHEVRGRLRLERQDGQREALFLAVHRLPRPRGQVTSRARPHLLYLFAPFSSLCATDLNVFESSPKKLSWRGGHWGTLLTNFDQLWSSLVMKKRRLPFAVCAGNH